MNLSVILTNKDSFFGYPAIMPICIAVMHGITKTCSCVLDCESKILEILFPFVPVTEIFMKRWSCPMNKFDIVPEKRYLCGTMTLDEVNTWIIFYLLSFVVLLLTLFFTTQGILLGIGLIMIILVIGVNFYLIWNELKKAGEKKELMRRLSKRQEAVSDDGKPLDELLAKT